MRTLLIRRSISVSASADRARTSRLGTGAWHFLAALTVVQGAHMVEHVVQLAQVTVLGVADDDALGLLGYVVQFNGTEEWLHLGYNATFALGLYALILPLWRATPAGLPTWAFWVFVAGCVWLETWHMIEHGVIIAGVLEHGGCPCPGIGDAALGDHRHLLAFWLQRDRDGLPRHRLHPRQAPSPRPVIGRRRNLRASEPQPEAAVRRRPPGTAIACHRHSDRRRESVLRATKQRRSRSVRARSEV